jgi:AmiR/NasT family two-component response regulator
MDELGLAHEFSTERLSLAIAEHDPADRQNTVALAKALGHEVAIEADAGDELILACDDHRIDVALLDCTQGMDEARVAIDLLNRLRIPAVIICSYEQRLSLEFAQEAGVFGFLVKPLTLNQLGSTLQMARFDFCLWRPGLNLHDRHEARRQAQTDILLAIAKLACEMNISTQLARRQLEDFAWEHCQTPLEAAGAVLAHVK